MTTKLEQAALALLAHWDTPAWKYLKPTGDLMADLREALAEQAEQEPAPWKHDCAALCMNDVELWIDNCPHCGKPRTAPSEPVKQEPVGYFAYDEEHDIWEELTGPNAPGATKLYAAPVQQAEQEPVAWMGTDTNNNPNKFRLNPFSNCVPLYAAPVRTKDLTDDEIYPLYNEPTSDREAIEFARAVIQEFRRKNGIV